MYFTVLNVRNYSLFFCKNISVNPKSSGETVSTGNYSLEQELKCWAGGSFTVWVSLNKSVWHFYFPDRIMCMHVVWHRYCASSMSELLLVMAHIWIVHSLSFKRMLSACNYFIVMFNSYVISYSVSPEIQEPNQTARCPQRLENAPSFQILFRKMYSAW